MTNNQDEGHSLRVSWEPPSRAYMPKVRGTEIDIDEDDNPPFFEVLANGAGRLCGFLHDEILAIVARPRLGRSKGDRSVFFGHSQLL